MEIRIIKAFAMAVMARLLPSQSPAVIRQMPAPDPVKISA
jgi:hypothetical protein